MVYYGIIKVQHEIKAQVMQTWAFKWCKGFYTIDVPWNAVVYYGTYIFKVQHGIKTQVMQTCCEYTILASCTAQHLEPKHGPEV